MAAAPSTPESQVGLANLQAKVQGFQRLSAIQAGSIVPDTATLFQCLLQHGVQSIAIKDAVMAAVCNAKTLETDTTAMTLFGRMLKAATSNLIVLVAPGINAQ
eukprot:1213457-Rhodomonas_salina.1